MSPIRKALMCGGASVMTLIATSAIFVPAAALAQSDEVRNFDIPAGDLGQALSAFSNETGLQLVYSSELVAGLKTAGVSGKMGSREALARLLAGTGLSIQIAGNTATLIKASDGNGERVLGAVRVQGAQGGSLPGSTPANGINGSRDVTATENTGSYTSNALTVGSKVAATIKDTPMAVSVITNQQIQDRNVTDLNNAMRDAPGVTTLNSGNDFKYYSRGFEINQVQIDGGAPLSLNGGNGVYRPIIDMSLYDHVELVRGATGTFNGYGDPGGVINLVRKRPLDHPQMLIEMQLGSWKLHRFSADITGPLGFAGKLRGRLIATHQDNDYFYRVSHLDRNVVSGTLELDLTSSTLLSAGANYQTQSGNAWDSGLPRFYDGSPLGLPRSTSLVVPGFLSKSSSLEVYAQIDQRIGSAWKFVLKATRSTQKADNSNALVYASGGIDPVSHNGLTVGRPSLSRQRNKQTLLEATLDGTFRLFGQEQKVVIGANYSMGDDSGSGQYFNLNNNIYLGKNRVSNQYLANVFDFDPYGWIIDLNAYTQTSGTDFGDTRTINAYTNIDISPLKHFHVSTSVRYSEYRRRSLSWTVCYQAQFDTGYCPVLNARNYEIAGGRQSGHNFSWPPSVSARYDIDRRLTAYATYADIYQDRSKYLDRDRRPLPPVTGMNFEGGLKWLSNDKKLNANLSVYYTLQKGVVTNRVCNDGAPCDNAPNVPGVLNSTDSCCFVSDPKSFYRSYGADLELTGEVRRGWQVAASYTFNRNEREGAGSTDYDGSRRPLQSQSPQHLFKIWSTYEFTDGSRFAGLRLGLGANGQSMAFVSTSRCTRYFTRGDGSPFFCLDEVPVHFSDPGHIVFDGSIGYKFNDKLRIDAEIENILDKTYYATIGDITGGNWYGAPRNIKVTLRGKF